MIDPAEIAAYTSGVLRARAEYAAHPITIHVGHPAASTCKRGHDLTPGNVYQRPGGHGVQCRTCSLASQKALRTKHKAKLDNTTKETK